MPFHRSTSLLLLITSLAGCGRPPASTQAAPSASLAPVAEVVPSASAVVSVATGPSALPPFGATPSGLSNVPAVPSADASERSLAPLLNDHLQGGISRAWSVGGELFVLSGRARPAAQFRAMLGYPAAAQEAAEGGRVLSVTEVHVVRAGEFKRVLQRASHLAPMVCDFDDCTLARLDPSVSELNGSLELGPGNCDKALAEMAKIKGNSTFDVFDRHVVPQVCRNRGRYAWNGRSFESTPPPSAAQNPTVLQESEIEGAIRTAMFPESTSQRPPQIFTAQVGVPTFAALTLDYPAHHAPLLTHSARTATWESARSLMVLEVWTSGTGGLRRVLQLPVGYSSVVDGVVELELAVDVQGDTLRVGDARGPCAGKSTETLPSPTKELDRELVTRVCAARGVYAFDGTRFVRKPS
jgi:hypothetical protein